MNQAKNSQLVCLNGRAISFCIYRQETHVVVGYLGERLQGVPDISQLSGLAIRQEVPASPMNEVPLSLLPLFGHGFTGNAAVQIAGQADCWAFCPDSAEIEQTDESTVSIHYSDSHRGLIVCQRISLDPHSDVLSLSTEVINQSDTEVSLTGCTSATIPIADKLSEILAFDGHWANEWNVQHQTLQVGSYVRENKRGKTSHDNFPGLFMHEPSTNQDQGVALGLHLGWSGNHKTLVERMADGRAYAQMGEWLYPGEVTLCPSQNYQSPTLYLSYSNKGFNGASQQFHRFVRGSLLTDQVNQTPRPVHYNTWEGIYFDHDPEVLKQLADRAAAIGAERFVLDDGWFPGRDDDTAGLGDWYVDQKAYPKGLNEIVDYVNELGLQFGLWFEPEMVNPDSELYRNHPEWVLQTPPNKDVGFRNQLVLDLTRSEVSDYLFERIDSILSEHNIAYVKWDMNRDVLLAGDQHGKPAVRNQTLALYALLDKLRAKHPTVEIESCASGGGRADFEILRRTDRVWTSDCNDALTRLSIQRGFSYFLPAELMGSHAGPRDCHITHRHLSMNLRAAVTLFGHMGMEMDLRELNDDEFYLLQQAIELYKKHRQLVHSGDLFRLDLRAPMHGFGIVAQNKDEALYQYALLNEHSTSMPGSFYFNGLDTSRKYKLNIIWPLKRDGKHWPEESIFGFDTALPTLDGMVFDGALLVNAGIQMPRLVPQSTLVFHLEAVD